MRISDWSSDVCSSDLALSPEVGSSSQHEGRALSLSCLAASQRSSPVTGVEMADRVHPGTTRNDTENRMPRNERRSEEHTSELQSLMRISYDVCSLKKKKRIERRNMAGKP